MRNLVIASLFVLNSCGVSDSKLNLVQQVDLMLVNTN